MIYHRSARNTICKVLSTPLDPEQIWAATTASCNLKYPCNNPGGPTKRAAESVVTKTRLVKTGVAYATSIHPV